MRARSLRKGPAAVTRGVTTKLPWQKWHEIRRSVHRPSLRPQQKPNAAALVPERERIPRPTASEGKALES